MASAGNSRVRVFAPATVSNLGPGFDVLGLALHKPGHVVDVEVTIGRIERNRSAVVILAAPDSAATHPRWSTPA